MLNNFNVSVIIPCYNRESSIIACINSVKKQTYPVYEIIVVDDGSTDNSVSLIKDLNDPLIKIICQKNLGGSAARNTGIEVAQGDLIAFLDSDDEFLPFHIEQACLKLSALNCNFVYSQIIVKRSAQLSFIKPPTSYDNKQHISEYLLAGRGFIQTSTIVLFNELAKKTMFDPELKYGQDTDFAIRVVSNGARIVMCEKPSVIWSDEYNEKRISSKINYINRIEWLNRIQSLITLNAYYADMGWPVAKGFRQDGMFFKSLYLFSKACIRGCYSPKLALAIFFQILLGNNFYRKLSDLIVKLGFKP